MRSMEKKKYMIILGTAHLITTSGKRSPDERLREPVYSREIVDELEAKLQSYGYNVMVDYRPLEEDKNMRRVSTQLNQNNRELRYRVEQVNKVCKQFGKANCLYVSIHVDAIGNDNQWHDANGWSVRVSPLASSKSKMLAESIFDQAEKHGLKVRKPTAKQKWWEQELFVLNQTECPAVLTENLFQDNKSDVDFLLSDEGRHAIVRLHLEGIINYINQLQ